MKIGEWHRMSYVGKVTYLLNQIEGGIKNDVERNRKKLLDIAKSWDKKTEVNHESSK